MLPSSNALLPSQCAALVEQVVLLDCADVAKVNRQNNKREEMCFGVNDMLLRFLKKVGKI